MRQALGNLVVDIAYWLCRTWCRIVGHDWAYVSVGVEPYPHTLPYGQCKRCECMMRADEDEESVVLKLRVLLGYVEYWLRRGWCRIVDHKWEYISGMEPYAYHWCARCGMTEDSYKDCEKTVVSILYDLRRWLRSTWCGITTGHDWREVAGWDYEKRVEIPRCYRYCIHCPTMEWIDEGTKRRQDSSPNDCPPPQ